MKKMLLMFVCMAAIGSMAWAGGGSDGMEGSGEAMTFKLAYNQLEPPEHPQGVTETKFKEKIEELSGGQIMVDVYYSGSLFTQEGEVTAMMTGDLEL